MTEIGAIITIEQALLPEEIAVLKMLAEAGGKVIQAIVNRQAGTPSPTPVLQAGEAAWNAMQQMATAHATGDSLMPPQA